jgi:hypothetical protein
MLFILFGGRIRILPVFAVSRASCKYAIGR